MKTIKDKTERHTSERLTKRLSDIYMCTMKYRDRDRMIKTYEKTLKDMPIPE